MQIRSAGAGYNGATPPLQAFARVGAVPRTEKRYPCTVALRVPCEIKALIEEKAAEAGMRPSELLRSVIEEWILRGLPAPRSGGEKTG